MTPVLWFAAVPIAVAAALSLRLIPSGQCLVVLRGSAVRRVVGPGLTALLPLRDRGARFSLEDQELPLVIRTVTRDAGEIVVLATLVFRISEPARAARASAVGPTTGALAEELCADAFAELTVKEIGRCHDLVLRDVASSVNLRSSLWGVTVTSLRIDEVDLRLVGP